MDFVHELNSSVLGLREAAHPIGLIMTEIRNSIKEEIHPNDLRAIFEELSSYYEFEELPSTTQYEENVIDTVLLNSWVPMYVLKTKNEINDILTEDSINYFVVMMYKKFEFLKSIYFQKIKRELRYYVFYESNKYDSEKIQKLISSELEIMDTYPDLFINFMYFPYGPDSSVFLSRESSKKIF